MPDSYEPQYPNSAVLNRGNLRPSGRRGCQKFRQRFAVVADEIAARLDIDRTPLEEYREKDMFLEDLSCCEPDMCDC